MLSCYLISKNKFYKNRIKPKMQTSVENYFWLVDRLSMEDDPANKVNVQKETVKLSDKM